jgi:hypothetical protein
MGLTTAVTVVNFASSIAQLFASGPSLVDLINAQTEMLKNIGERLTNIEKGIADLLERTDELRTLIGHAPRQTVIELYNARLRGLFHQDRELMEAFAIAVDERGIANARKLLQPRFEAEILGPLRTVLRDVLALEEVATIPIVARTLDVEVRMMLMLDYHIHQSEVLRAALNAYERWFEGVQSKSDDSVARLTQAARGERADLRVKAAAVFNEHRCLTKLKSESHHVEHANGASWERTMTTATLHRHRHHYEETPTDFNAEGLADLIEAGVVTADDLPSQLVPRPWEARESTKLECRWVNAAIVTAKSSNASVLPGKPKKVADALANTPKCKKLAPAATPDATRISQQLHENGLSLVTLLSFDVVCRETLARITNLRDHLQPKVADHA